MREHVAVGVTREPAVEVEAHAAEDQRHAALELVRIDADPDAEAHGSTAGSSSSDSILIAPAGGSCR
jgi:hypothetical protein